MIYQPAEDSYFLSKILKEKIKDKDIKCLDLGTGSGIQSKTLIKLGIPKENITSSDINPDALKQAKKLGVKTKKSNLFQNIKNKFDLIIFNPPYLPESKYDNKPDTTGGKKGDEIILKFIIQLPEYLTENGKSFLLTSSLTPNKNWQKLANNLKLTVTKTATKKLFFEELYIWEIKLMQ